MTMRTFHLFTEPSLADPAWQIQMCEGTGPGVYVNYSDLSVLKALISEMEEKWVRKDERNKATSACLEVFGLTWDDYITRMRQNRAAVENANGRESAPPTTAIRD